jgi:hypothetical protein
MVYNFLSTSLKTGAQCRGRSRNSPRELLVLDPARHHAVFAQSPLLVFLVVLEVAFKPFHVAVAFEGEDMQITVTLHIDYGDYGDTPITVTLHLTTTDYGEITVTLHLTIISCAL